jgi:hypothetical protein
MALRFPSDLPSKYYFSLGFEEYSRPDPFKSLVQLTQVSGDAGMIQLPIPQNIIDTQMLKWQAERVLLGEVLGDSWDAFTKDGDYAELANDAMAAGLLAPGAIGGAVGAALGQGSFSQAARNGINVATGGADVVKSLLQKAGLAINPVLAMMFEHPEYKKHSFQWKLAPQTPAESDTIMAIIEAVRFNSLPEAVHGGLFFKYPSIAKIQIHTGGGQLYRFQPSVIDIVEVNYAANPAQVPSFFAGTSAPTEISLKIDFIEIILNTRNNTQAVNSSASVPLNFSFGGGGAASGIPGIGSVTSILGNLNGRKR